MKFRRVIFWGHLISGLFIGLVLLVMAVTGMALAFEPQLVSFSQRHVEKIPSVPENPQRLSLNLLAEKASEARPTAKMSGINLESDPLSSIVFAFGKGGGRALYLNPYNGTILGEGSALHDFMHFIEDIHRSLTIKEFGKKITGACNLAFFFMALSGIYLWFPKKWVWSLIETRLLFSQNLKGRAKDWNWHNVIGFWCLPMILITTLTGAVMSYAWANHLLFRLSGSEPPAPMQQRMGEKKTNETKSDQPKTEEKKSLINFDQMFQAAEQKVPDWSTIMIRMPREGKGPVSLWIVDKKSSRPFMRSQLSLDAKTGEVVKWEPYSESSRGRRARVWVRYLHTGEAWGLLGQTLAGLSAFGTLMLVWTGFAMAWYRFFKPNGTSKNRQNLAQKIS